MVCPLKITVNEAAPLPIYRQVGEQIRRYIQDCSLSEGTLLPSIQTLASTAGVSLQTTERAVNLLVKEGVCFRRPKKGTYVGAGRKTPTKPVCGVYHAMHLASFENDVVHATIHRGIVAQAKQHRMDLFHITGDARETIAFCAGQDQLKLTGVVMLNWEDLTEVKALSRRFEGVQFVLMNHDLAGFEDTPPNVHGVFNDDFGGAYRMTEHLIGKGHRRVAVLSIDLVNENYRQRIAGYRSALEHNGIRFDSGLVYRMPGDPDVDLKDTGRILATRLMSGRTPPTAVLAVNDFLASGAREYLTRANPGPAIEVAGYDNIVPHVSRDGHFSTVWIDFERMGGKAIDILMNQKADYPKVIRIPPRLLTRG